MFLHFVLNLIILAQFATNLLKIFRPVNNTLRFLIENFNEFSSSVIEKLFDKKQFTFSGTHNIFFPLGQCFSHFAAI